MIATCHPEERGIAKGLCMRCYQRQRTLKILKDELQSLKEERDDLKRLLEIYERRNR